MIVVCGEALIDMLPRKGADSAAVFQPFVGGSPYNVAIALGRLDEKGLLTKSDVAGLSEGQVGDLLAFAAKAASITCSRPGADPPWRRELA